MKAGVDIHIQTPESDKMLAVHAKSQAIGEFLDWLRDERGITLAEFGHTRHDSDELYMVRIGINELLAEYFEIDLNKVEREKRAILDGVRASYAATDKSS